MSGTKTSLTKKELEEEYFQQFLKWCATAPKGPATLEMIFWLDHRFPTEENFWEWMVTTNRAVL